MSFRQTIQLLLHPLRRVRPRTPFWNIPAHRVPTIRLYRHLLREAPSDAVCQIRFRLRLLWRKNQHLTSVEQTKKALQQGYKYLTNFRRAKEGDSKLKVVLDRYSRLIDTKCTKEYWKFLASKELVWRAKLRYRPIVTGAHFPSSIYHGPLPRMINQPTKLSQIIRWRYEANEKRIPRQQTYLGIIHDLKVEAEAEIRLARMLPPRLKAQVENGFVFAGRLDEWVEPYNRELNHMNAAFAHAKERAQTPYSPELLASLKAARRVRIINKARERARERRGEMTTSFLQRMSKGPPAHVLCKMSDRQKALDKAARTLSEVGFSAIAKRNLGARLKKPEAWRAEESPEKKEELDREARIIRQKNHCRRIGLLQA